jgi:hypothetical protein
VHPGGRFNGVRRFELPIPIASGHDFVGNTRYRVSLTATDSDRLENLASVTVYPEKVNLSFQSVPNGRTIKIDGLSYVTPFLKDSLVNYQHAVEAVDTSDHIFSSWSDGGAQTHALVVPARDSSYTVIFNPPEVPRITAVKYASGTLSLSFASAVGWSYIIESKENLGDGSWVVMLTVPGDGSVQTVSDPQPPGASRFFRLRLE